MLMEMSGDIESYAIPVGKRISPRARLILKGRIETLEGIQPVEIVSLSRTGAMVMVKDVPRLASNGILIWGPIDAFFTIVWTDTHRCGLHFDEPISEEKVIAARETSDHDPVREQAKKVAIAKAWATGAPRDG